MIKKEYSTEMSIIISSEEQLFDELLHEGVSPECHSYAKEPWMPQEENPGFAISGEPRVMMKRGRRGSRILPECKCEADKHCHGYGVDGCCDNPACVEYNKSRRSYWEKHNESLLDQSVKCSSEINIFNDADDIFAGVSDLMDEQNWKDFI